MVNTTATFSLPGEYIIRIEGNDSSGVGGGGFQCCWTTAYIKAVIKPANTAASKREDERSVQKVSTRRDPSPDGSRRLRVRSQRQRWLRSSRIRSVVQSIAR